MPLDILCPSCRSPFPVTNDGPEFHVECPECDAGIGVSVAQPDAGKIGSVPQASARLADAPAAKRVPATAPRSLDDDDDAPKRRTGSTSAWVVIFGSAVGLLLVLASVGTTGYFLFTNLDTDDPSARAASSPSESRTPGGGTHTIYVPNPNPNFTPSIPRPGPTFTPPPSPNIPRPGPTFTPPPSRPSLPRRK